MSGQAFTRKDVEAIIANYKAAGRDTSELEALLHNGHGEQNNVIAGMDEEIAKLRDASPVSNGECSLCGAKGELTSGVCQKCFDLWAASIIKARQKRGKREYRI